MELAGSARHIAAGHRLSATMQPARRTLQLLSLGSLGASMCIP